MPMQWRSLIAQYFNDATLGNRTRPSAPRIIDKLKLANSSTDYCLGVEAVEYIGYCRTLYDLVIIIRFVIALFLLCLSLPPYQVVTCLAMVRTSLNKSQYESIFSPIFSRHLHLSDL